MILHSYLSAGWRRDLGKKDGRSIGANLAMIQVENDARISDWKFWDTSQGNRVAFATLWRGLCRAERFRGVTEVMPLGDG